MASRVVANHEEDHSMTPLAIIKEVIPCRHAGACPCTWSPTNILNYPKYPTKPPVVAFADCLWNCPIYLHATTKSLQNFCLLAGY
mmetsp:Transcript_109919/g.190670  ORF Transcript_109919/g.190670 Transcript_109919/m.190670 type:complete len:85 (+) Transcript_109919:2911-3165(+)